MILTPEEAKKMDLIKTLRERAELEDSVRWWFRFSDLWHAIVDHIAKDKDNDAEHCVLIQRPEGQPIAFHRGTGAAISFCDAHLYAMDYEKRPPREAPVFRVKIDVAFYDKETLEDDYPREIRQEFEIQVPTALARNFTKQAFAAWIKKLRTAKEKEVREADMIEIKRLVAKYPGAAELRVALGRNQG